MYAGRAYVLAPVLPLLLSVAEAERYDVFVAHERLETVNVGYDVGASTGDDSQVHRGNLAVWLRLGLIKVGVAVDEEQPVPPGAPEREHDADDIAAIAAEHER